MSNKSFNYAATARRVTEREVNAARLAPDYRALVEHFGLNANDFKALDSKSQSKCVTEIAQIVVLDGAHAMDTKVAKGLTIDDLKGRDPGDVATRDFWKAARAVRIGLVTAIGKDEAKRDTDWLRLVRQAVENAHNHNHSEDAIVAAMREVLSGEGE